MSEQQILFYKITEYIVISNPSGDVARRKRNRKKPGPLLKIYNKAKGAEMTDTTPAINPPNDVFGPINYHG
jgi:hypothetical protein